MAQGHRLHAIRRGPLTTPDGRVGQGGASSGQSTLGALELEALLPLLLAVSGFVGVAPLVFIRAANGSYAVAIIDAMIALSFVGVAWAIYRYNAVRRASVILAVVATAGVVAVVYMKGSEMVFWAYPTVVALFFLLRPLEALAFSVVTVAAVIPALVAEEATRVTTVVILSFVITLGDAAAFAALTVAQRRKLQAMALIDPLTGTANRRAMDEVMPEIMATSRSSDSPASLLMLDVDYFKRINDEYGHAVGDRVLISVACCIGENTRPTDRLFRIGGEEFAVIVENGGVKLAQRLGEILREAVAVLAIPATANSDRTLSVTISLGVAELLPDESADRWYKRADDALYAAKRSGRNRTSLADKAVGLSGTATYATG